VIEDNNNNNNSSHNNNNNGNNNTYNTVEKKSPLRRCLIKECFPSPTMVNIRSGLTLKTNMRVVVFNKKVETTIETTTTTTTIMVDSEVETNVEEIVVLVMVGA
jgi:uncharacterized FAD-dependent dehydrogenase